MTTPPIKPLKAGWNLIGYYGTDAITMYDGPDEYEGRKASCALYSLGSTYFDKGWTSLMSYWEPYNPYQWWTHSTYPDAPGLGYNDRMDPGAGYWIFTPEDELYVYTTTCDGLFP